MNEKTLDLLFSERAPYYCRGEKLHLDKSKVYGKENLNRFFEWFYAPTGCQLFDTINKTYNHQYIIDAFQNKNTIFFGTPILFDQYAKAIREYVKYGKLMYFPEEEVYKMARKIIKNTVLMVKVSTFFSTTKYLPKDFLENSLIPYYSQALQRDFKISELDNGNYLEYTLPKDVAKTIFSKEMDFFETQYSKFFKKYSHHYFLKKDIKVVSSIDENEVVIAQSIYSVLKEIGLFDFLYEPHTEEIGLKYISYYLRQLNDNMTPEELLVWINKMVNIYHFRSDLSKYFIEGGAENLDKLEFGLIN